MRVSCVEGLVRWLRSQGDCVIELGLTESELTEAESFFGIEFSEVWSEVLSQVHPFSLAGPPPDLGFGDGPFRWVRYPDWRMRDVDPTLQKVALPVEGVLFDVERNGFWWRRWGPRPESMSERLDMARSRLATIPLLTPIHGHQFVSSQSNSPVLSISQTDLWCSALTLCDLPIEHDESEVGLEDSPIG